MHFGFLLNSWTAKTSCSTKHLERTLTTISKYVQHFFLSRGQTKGKNVENIAEFAPIIHIKPALVFSFAVQLNFSCATNCTTSIAPQSRTDRLKHLVVKLNPIKLALENVNEFLGGVFTKVNLVESILEKSKQLMSLSRCKQISLLLEIKLKTILAPLQSLALRTLWIEHSEKTRHQLLGKFVTFIEQHSHFLVQNEIHEQALKETFFVLDCRAVHFHHGMLKTFSETLRKFSLT